MYLALAEINSQGGINGKALRLVQEDDRCDGRTGATAIRKLIDLNKVSAVIAGVCSSVAMAIAPIANETHTPLVVPFASAPALADAGPYVFKIMPSDALQGTTTARWIREMGHSRVAALYTNNAWGVGLLDAFRREAKVVGLNLTDVEASEDGARDFRTQLVRIRATRPSALFAPMYPKEAGQMFKQLKEMGLKYAVFGGDPWGGSRDLLETAGPAAEGAFFTAPLQYKGPEYSKFANAFRKKYEEDPDAPAAAGYDALHVVAVAMKGGTMSPQIIAGLSGLKNYVGATGNTTFDNHGSVTTKGFARMTIASDAYVPFVNRQQ